MRIVSAFALLLALAPSALGATAETSPETTVRALYAADRSSIEGKDSGVMGNRAARARYFSREVLRALEADERAADARKEPPTIEGDPFTDEQEPGLKDLRISPVSASVDKAKVLAEFDRGDGAREKLTYSLTFERGLWRIEDIGYSRADGSADSLRELLKMK